MEFIFELLFDLIFEGSLELGRSHRVPMAIRIAALAVFLATAICVVGLMFFITVIFVMNQEYIFAFLTGALGVTFLVFIILNTVRCIRTRS